MIRLAYLSGACMAVFAVASSAHAQSFAQCEAAAGGVTTRLRDCNAAELTVRDRQLNQIYAQLLRSLPPARQAGLRVAERAWIGYRDAECAFRVSGEAGGSDAPLVAEACRLELTGARIGQLRKAQTAANF